MSNYLESFNTFPSSWTVSQVDYEIYATKFKSYASNGWLDAGTARNIFSQSNLPTQVLFQIWSLADAQQLGKLNEERFVVAMHLIFKILGGAPLPSTLPEELKPGNLINNKGLTINPYSEKIFDASQVVPFSLANLNSKITELKCVRDRKKQLLENILNVDHQKVHTEVDVENSEKDIKMFVNESAIAKSLFKLDDLIIGSKLQPIEDRLESALVNINTVKAVECEKLLKKAKEINQKTLDAELELFTLEDSKKFGYTIPSTKSNLTPINISNGNDPIAQKAAALLNQRLQALNMASGNDRIPADAETRINYKKQELISKKQASDLEVETAIKEISSLLAEADKIFISKSTNEQHSFKDLNDHFTNWKEIYSNSSNLGKFLKEIFNELPTQRVKKIIPANASQADNKILVASLPSNRSVKPALNVAQSNTSDNFIYAQSNKSDITSHQDEPDSYKTDNQFNLANQTAKEKLKIFEKDVFEEVIGESSNLSHSAFRSESGTKKIPDVQSNGKYSEKIPQDDSGFKLGKQPISEVIGLNPFDSFKNTANSSEPLVQPSTEAPTLSNNPFDSLIKEKAPPASKPEPTKIDPDRLFGLGSTSTVENNLNLFDPSQEDEDLEQPFQVKALYDYVDEEDEGPTQIHFKVSDTVVITSHPPDNLEWCLGYPQSLGEEYTGWIPSSYLDLKNQEPINLSETDRQHTYKQDHLESEVVEQQDTPPIEQPVEVFLTQPVIAPIVSEVSTTIPAANNDKFASEVSPTTESLSDTKGLTNPFKVQALFDYVDEEDSATHRISFKTGDAVVVLTNSPDNPEWCFGYPEQLGEVYLGWIPSSYLDLESREDYLVENNVAQIQPEAESDANLDEEAVCGYAQLAEDFEAEVDGQPLLFPGDQTIKIIDISDADWHLAKHPITSQLAYLPSNHLTLVDKEGNVLELESSNNPFAKLV